MERGFQRSVAYKLKIADILNGSFIKSKEDSESYLKAAGLKVKRVNIIAVIISEIEDLRNILAFEVEDGSGKIAVRHFPTEDDKLKETITSLGPGKIVTLIARPRSYNNELYLVAEIVKEIKDREWIKIRNYEIRLIKEKFYKTKSSGQETREESIKTTEKESIAKRAEQEYKQEKTIEQIENINSAMGKKEEEIKISETHVSTENNAGNSGAESYFDRMLSIISSLDSGKGAEYEEAIAKAENAGIPEARKLLDNMLKEGDVFELRPGFIKVL